MHLHTYEAEVCADGRVISAEKTFSDRNEALEWIRPQMYGVRTARAFINLREVNVAELWGDAFVTNDGTQPSGWLQFQDKATQQRTHVLLAVLKKRYEPKRPAEPLLELTRKVIVDTYEELSPAEAFEALNAAGITQEQIGQALGDARASEFALWAFVNLK